MNPKIGRPISDNPRLKRVETKMTIEELKKLDYCCEFSGKTRSEVIREGVDIIFAKLNKSSKK